MIGFIAPYILTQFGTTGNYSAIAIFQFIFQHTLRFLVFTSRILATDLSQLHSNFNSHMKSSCHFCSCQFRRLNSTTLDYCWILPATLLLLLLLPASELDSLITTLHGPHGNTACIVDEAFLPRRYLAIDVRSHTLVPAGMCLPTRCLAMGIHVTV
jgi:hypothetical protein